MSILKLKPQFVERIWGGSRLATSFKVSMSAPIGEAWIISGYPTTPSLIVSGDYAGMTLRELYHTHREEFAYDTSTEFPLLVKLIDAAADLSVQVHPNDDYAQRHASDNGKSESWMILDAQPASQLQWGHHARTRVQLNDMIDQGQWRELLDYRPVHAGEVYYIPAGTVHAICRGTYLLEVQQSSDVTYRLYDYDRKDAQGKLRPLHLQDAKNVITVPAHYEQVQSFNLSPTETGKTTILMTPYFTIEQWVSQSTLQISNPNRRYFLVYVIEGKGLLNGVTLTTNDSFVITSTTTQISITGDVSLIVTYPPSR